MAQPNFEVFGQCLKTLGTQVPLINNHPVVNQNAQILAAIQGMEDRLVARIDQVNAGIDQMNAHIDQMNVGIDQMNARVDKLAQTHRTNDKKSLARALNSSAFNGEAQLYPLPLPNGDEIPEGQFPNTLGDLRELEGARLAGLLEAYKLVAPPNTSVYDKQGILAKYCGIR